MFFGDIELGLKKYEGYSMFSWFTNLWSGLFGKKSSSSSSSCSSKSSSSSSISSSISSSLNSNGGRKMQKKALIVGINRYPDKANWLNGCINDALLVNETIRQVWQGITNENIRMLTDDSATTANIMDRLKWLVQDAQAGDVLLFTYSGHGAEIASMGDSYHTPGTMDQVICFTGDTKIPLLDGTEKTMKELAENYSDKSFWVYSIDKNRCIKPGKAYNPRLTRKNVDVVEVILDNKESIKCTPDHLFMMRDGTYKKACKLEKNDSLMPLYRQYHKNKNKIFYEQVYNPIDNDYVKTHKLTACKKLDDNVEKRAKLQNCGVLIHHKNFKPTDNRPENLEYMTWREHGIFHLNTNKKLWANEEHRKRMKDLWDSKEYREIQSNAGKERWKNADDSERKRISDLGKAMSLKRMNDPEHRAKWLESHKKQDLTNFKKGRIEYAANLTPEERSAKARKAGSTKGKKGDGYAKRMRNRWLDPVYRAFMIDKQSKAMKNRWQDPEKRKLLNNGNVGVLNHKVVSVKPCGKEDVYDFTVEEYENFALSSGIFVHNCPWDFDWRNNVIRDEDLMKMFANVPVGVNLTVISDSCHSGDLLKDMVNPTIQPSGSPNKARCIQTPPDISNRAYGLNLKPKSKGIRNVNNDQIGILVSACRSDQTAADAWINVTGKFQGACTYYLSEVLKENNYDITYVDAVNKVNVKLAAAGYDQQPQLDCKEELQNKKFLQSLV